MAELDEIFGDQNDNQSSTPKIDLYNFEEAAFEDSKYVLTSPRSLEACARIGVKPVDLLYKPLSDFQEDLLPQDVPLRTIYNIYDEHEQDRLRKLKLCRSERNRITPASAVTKSRKKVPYSASRVNRTERTGRALRQSDLKKSYSDEDLSKSKGSMQRRRTAWATSVGHSRVTKDELSKRVSELHEESMKLRNELLSKKDKKARPRSARKTKVRRSKSACSMSVSGTTLLNTSSIREARPIENTSLRKTLSKSQDLTGIAVTPRDQKILELMMSKGEEEKLSNRNRHRAEMAWDMQRKMEEDVKVQTEMRRRQMLAEENRIKDMKKKQKDRNRKSQEEKIIECKEQNLEESWKQWERQSQTQLKMKELQLSERREKEELRKRIQETNKLLLNKDEEEMMEMIKRKNENDVKSASQKKENRLFQESMRKLMENRNQRNAVEDRLKQLEKMTKKEEDALENTINMKHKHATLNYQQVLDWKDRELNLSRMEREKRILQAKLNQQKMDEEMDDWRESVKSHREAAEKHAAETAARTIEQKARQAYEERANKEKTQRQNIKKLNKEERARRHEVEVDLALKDQKAKSVELDKSVAMHKLRQVAHQSQVLRNDLRERYGGESFDKKVFRAELYNKLHLGAGPYKSTKNSGSVKL